jgi:Family of unknown function (DUF5677)
MPAIAKDRIKLLVARFKIYCLRVKNALCPTRVEKATPFETHGFLSDEIEGFRAVVRTRAPYKEWFDFAQELNLFGSVAIRAHTFDQTDTQRMTISALFIRSHQSVQAAMVLIERGMIADARTVLRTLVEGTIAQISLAADVGVVDQLVAHRKHQLTICREMLADEKYREQLSQAQIAQLEAIVSEMDLLKDVPGKEPRHINWADLAKKHCAELHLLLYRPLSSDGTHTTVDSINRHLEADEEFRITGLKGGPELTDIVDTLSITCLSFIWSLNSFEQMRGADGQQVQSFLQKFKELSNDQPIQLKIG